MLPITIERTEVTPGGAHALYATLKSTQPLSLTKLVAIEYQGYTYVPFVAHFTNHATATFLGIQAGYLLEYRALRR